MGNGTQGPLGMPLGQADRAGCKAERHRVGGDLGSERAAAQLACRALDHAEHLFRGLRVLGERAAHDPQLRQQRKNAHGIGRAAQAYRHPQRGEEVFVLGADDAKGVGTEGARHRVDARA